MKHDLSPAFVQLSYHSPYGVHKMTLPTRAWSPGIGTNPQGGWLNWNDVGIDADDTITAFVALLAAHQPNTVSWDSYVIFTKADADSPSFPVAGNVLTQVGTSIVGGWFAAVVKQLNGKDTAYNTCKIAIIEASSGGDFSRIAPAGFTAADTALVNAWEDPDQAWSSRAGNKPNQVYDITTTLNDKLRAEYHIT